MPDEHKQPLDALLGCAEHAGAQAAQRRGGREYGILGHAYRGRPHTVRQPSGEVDGNTVFRGKRTTGDLTLCAHSHRDADSVCRFTTLFRYAQRKRS